MLPVSPPQGTEDQKRKPVVLSLTLEPAGNSAAILSEAWADVSVDGGAMVPDIAQQRNTPTLEDTAPLQPSSRASSESGWEMPQADIPQRQAPAGKRSKAPSSVASSKASKVSNALDNVSGFRKKQPPV